ncbi:MAG: hypothetical protein ACRCST_02590 [Turicibacter sp.]
MANQMDIIKQLIEEKREGTKNQGKLKRPDKQVGEGRKRVKRHKKGGIFDK